MKILIATPIFPPESGGPARYVSELAGRLDTRHDVTVLAYADNPSELSRGKLVFVPKSGNILIRLWNYFKYCLLTLTLGWKADVVYAQGGVSSGLPALYLYWIRRTPYIVKFVGDEAWERARMHNKTTDPLYEFMNKPAPTFYTKLLRFSQMLVLRQAKIVTTPSKYLSELIADTYKLLPDQVKVNYNPTNLPDTSTPERVPFSILTTNRLTRWKHVDEIIKALEIIKKQFPEATLTLAGDGPERKELEALVNERNLIDSVSFLGDVSPSKIDELLSESSVFVLNSSYEGLPFGVLEAFAAKIPVVATSIPGTNELVNPETGWPTNSENAIPLAEMISEVFTNPEKAKTKCEAAYALLEKDFSWKSHLSKLEEFFKPRKSF